MVGRRWGGVAVEEGGEWAEDGEVGGGGGGEGGPAWVEAGVHEEA